MVESHSRYLKWKVAFFSGEEELEQVSAVINGTASPHTIAFQESYSKGTSRELCS